MAEVWYRKWRPHTLGEVVGQEPIIKTLINALNTKRVAHAYLFFGPRGTGKTSTGRLLAKAINCQSNKSGEPCNDCIMCKSFDEGRALDFIEIDAASNRGIDEIRDLKERINYTPNVASFKVYIIDEVHMLTEPAFNALLKTLEEPPPHIIFILATTEVHKVPATITSRCQRFDFRKIPESDMVSRLEYICQQEKIEADPQSLALISKMATGSLRDAINLLERMMVYHGSKIELAQVRAELGITGDFRIKELAAATFKYDLTLGLSMIGSVVADGLDLRQFNREFVEYLRGILLVKAGAGATLNFSPEEQQEADSLSENVTVRNISDAIKLFSQADLRHNPQSALSLEMALVDYVLLQNKSQSNEASAEVPKSPVPQVNSVKEPSVQIRPAQVSLVNEQTDSPASTTPKKLEATPSVQIPPPQGSSTLDHISAHWNEFVNACRGEGSRGNLDALLRRSCKPVSLEGNTLVLGFYAEFQKSKIEDPKYGQMVKKKLADVFGVSYDINCIIIDTGQRPGTKSFTDNPLVEEAISLGGKIISEE